MIFAAARWTLPLSRLGMRFTIRKLMLFVFLASLCAFAYSWHHWYNHRIAYVEIGNGFVVRFWSEYESWRGPRRILGVTLCRNGAVLQDYTCRVKSHWQTEIEPRVFETNDGRFACVTYPTTSKNFVLVDFVNGDSSIAFHLRSHQLMDDATKLKNEIWYNALKQIRNDNPKCGITM